MYGLLMTLRNWCFNHGWLEQRKADVPVISVGNLAVGGTGKTPMVEFLLRQLQSRGQHPAVVSRGYGRRTRGPLVANASSTADDIGDEPLQIYRKFGSATTADASRVPVIVSEDRRKALPLLAQEAPDCDVLLLDDAYQHRYVQRDCNILLTDYHRLYTRDRVLPWGRLREPRRGAQRADIVVVTKCPATLTPQEAEAIRTELALCPAQQLFFATIGYGPLPPELIAPVGGPQIEVNLLTGIANPGPLLDHLASQGVHIQQHLCYGDHHRFSESERENIKRLASTTFLLTTEKDAARLPDVPVMPIPIETRILFDQTDALLSSLP